MLDQGLMSPILKVVFDLRCDVCDLVKGLEVVAEFFKLGVILSHLVK